ncbi:MAG: hypothetical protein K5864_05290 [Bacteroidales bacterium]|nr:hypothetical protein [Bacteroidales bacterium]
MHLTELIYRTPYWPTWPLIQVTQRCTHNSSKLCTMYRGVPFLMQSMKWMDEDLRELMRELKTFLELLTCDCEPNTLHTSSRQPTVPFLPRKQQILDSLQEAIDHADFDAMTRRRQQKRGL